MSVLSNESIDEIVALINAKIGPAGAFSELARMRCIVRKLLNERDDVIDGLRKIRRVTKGLPKRSEEAPVRKSDETIDKLRKIRAIARNRLKTIVGGVNGDSIQDTPIQE